MKKTGLLSIMLREFRLLSERRVYLWAMIIVPVGVALFFLSLMSEGLPLKVPTAIVDLDNSQVSRTVCRSLNAQELTDITLHLDSYHEAIEKVRSGEIFGFFYIPRNFAEDAIAGRGPTITYYSNLTYFVPGSLAFKGFKTMAVGTSGSIVETTLSSLGVPGNMSNVLLQPMVIDLHPMGNPWTNYSIYLSNSFVPAALELMIFLVTVFSICQEIKTKRSIEWLAQANGSVVKALFGKLFPQTIIFTAVGFAIQALFYGFSHFPLNGSTGNMLLAMFLFVVACQSFGVIISSALPNLRLALSVCSLSGILAFSIAGFSFPVDQMYGAIGIFSYILPVRWYFLIYIDQALNGIPLYYSRIYYAVLLAFPLCVIPLLWHLKRYIAKPVYIP